MSSETQRTPATTTTNNGGVGNSSDGANSSSSKTSHNSQPTATEKEKRTPQSLLLRNVIASASNASTSHHHQPTSTGGTTAGNPARTDEIEVQTGTGQKAGNNAAGNGKNENLKSGRSIGWIVCAPCIFLRTSTTFKKMALTTLTLLVTSLLVASPILFLTQFALPARDCTRNHCIPPPKFVSSPECQDVLCKNAANSIQARMNWKADPCNDFYSYCCSNNPVNTIRAVKSAQERADTEMQMLLSQNTTSGIYRKLGRLYGSCLRQSVVNASSIRLMLDELGGYMPIGAIGPHTLSTIMSRISSYGYNSLFDVHFDLTYGRKPHIVLVIDVPFASPNVLERKIRWRTMKAPRFVHLTFDRKTTNDVIDNFIPIGLSREIALREKQTILSFIDDLLELRYSYMSPDFSNGPSVYNLTTINKISNNINFTEFLPDPNWNGSIVLRNEEYFKQLDIFLTAHPKRVIHNALLILFALNSLPAGGSPNAATCTRAVQWAMPELSSALYVGQFSQEYLANALQRADVIFESIKAHLKRAPSLRGTALVKLSALKLQGETWPSLYNATEIHAWLDEVEISSDNWIQNVMRIYRKRSEFNGFGGENITSDSQIIWSYPTIARPFYDPLSQSIVIPASLLVHPYFDPSLPQYLQYATVGVPIAKEILRSVSRKFEEKLRKCVPNSIDDYPKYTRQSILVYSGALQMSFHALLHQTGSKNMNRIPGLDLTPTQIYFIVAAQEFQSDFNYLYNRDNNSAVFSDLLHFLVPQGGSASKSFTCASDTRIYKEKTCDIW